MQYPPIADDHDLSGQDFPGSKVDWAALDPAVLASYHDILTEDVLIDAHDSFLVATAFLHRQRLSVRAVFRISRSVHANAPARLRLARRRRL